nr:MAG TPA: hypothetical protein [Caudoviricetes sp.]
MVLFLPLFRSRFGAFRSILVRVLILPRFSRLK